MPNPEDYTKFPSPDSSSLGRNHRESGSEPLTRTAKKYRPRGVGADEVPAATLARVAHRITNKNGKALTAEELGIEAPLVLDGGEPPPAQSLSSFIVSGSSLTGNLKCDGVYPVVGWDGVTPVAFTRTNGSTVDFDGTRWRVHDGLGIIAVISESGLPVVYSAGEVTGWDPAGELGNPNLSVTNGYSAVPSIDYIGQILIHQTTPPTVYVADSIRTWALLGDGALSEFSFNDSRLVLGLVNRATPKVLFTALSIWSWITSKIAAANNITAGGTWAFTNAQRPTTTGTGIPSASNLITRSDIDTVLLVGSMRDVFALSTEYLATGGGSAIESDGSCPRLNSAGSTSSSQSVGLTQNVLVNSSTGGGGACSIPFAIACNTMVGMAAQERAEIVFIYGHSYATALSAMATAPAQPQFLTTRGFGFKIYYSAANARFEVFVFTHNGTTYTQSAAQPVGTIGTGTDTPFSFCLSHSGSGTVKLFSVCNARTDISPTALITATEGPFDGNYNNPYFSAFVRTGSVVPSSNTAVRIFRTSVNYQHLP